MFALRYQQPAAWCAEFTPYGLSSPSPMAGSPTRDSAFSSLKDQGPGNPSPGWPGSPEPVVQQPALLANLPQSDLKEAGLQGPMHLPLAAHHLTQWGLRHSGPTPLEGHSQVSSLYGGS